MVGNPTRRDFLKAAATLAALPVAGCVVQPIHVGSPYESAIPEQHGELLVVNDVHSQLNATQVGSIVKPTTVDDLRKAIIEAQAAGRSVSIAGGRHAMGGQQFADAGLLV